jgi:predicted SprT family Zn-dependent metalloprotease
MSAVDAMTEPEVLAYARDLLDQHGVEDFRVALSGRMTRTYGICDFRNREVRISRQLAAINDRSVTEDVIRHEVAHALAGPGHGHGPKWREMCSVTGAEPRACIRTDEIATVKKAQPWKATCDACGEVAGRRTKPPRAAVPYTHVAKYCAAGGGPISWSREGAR